MPAGREVAFEMRPIGFMGTPFADTAAIPKGPGAEHRAEGWVELLPAYVAGVAWVFAWQLTASFLYHAPAWKPVAVALIGY